MFWGTSVGELGWVVDLRILWVWARWGGRRALCVSGVWGVLKESLRGERVGVRGGVSGGRKKAACWKNWGAVSLVRGLGLGFGGG